MRQDPDWRGVPGLRTGVSFYYCPNTGANSDQIGRPIVPAVYPVEIFSWDAEYSNRYLTARADSPTGMWATAAQSMTATVVFPAHRHIRVSPLWPRMWLSYGAEFGLTSAMCSIYSRMSQVHAVRRYEYCNPQKVVEKPYVADKRLR